MHSKNSQGRFYVGADEALAPMIHLLPPTQIQKLADRSDVISEIPKCSKIQTLPDPLTDGKGSLPLSRTPPPLSALRASFLRSQGLTHYIVGNPY